MKNILISLLCLLSTGVLMADEVKPAHIYGKIQGFKGGLVTVNYYDTEKIDTVTVNADGTFDYATILEASQKGVLLFEDYKCSVDLFVENGMDASLDLSFVQGEYEGMVTYEPAVDYRGDNADCTAFMDAYMDWSLFENPWSWDRLDTLSFAEYREQYLEDVDSVKRELMKVKSLAFKRMMMEIINMEIPNNLFRFAWAEPKADADFECWVESFDRNDPENIDMASNYVRWYGRWHRAVEGESPYIHYLANLKEIFTNQEVINAFADDYIMQYLQGAPEGMADVLAYYKTVSTNREAHAAADKVYEHYKRLVPGSQALDFTMTDRKGKVFHLSDFRGKAVYIDVWATWCGPCCAEIPHMEKLAAHYAKNKKIELISISLDEDHAKWEKKLAEDKPEWKQFICPDAFKSALCKNYDINGIPRFLFFDKDGKVISLDAPRPSAENIIEYIDKHLAE